jgi:hypothetical protein
MAARPYRFVWLAVAVLALGCSTLPPVRPVTGVGQIAGQWQGKGSGPDSQVDVTLAIDPDGSYSMAFGPVRFTGKITLVDGRLRGRGNETGATGTYTLHEGEGQRVLVYRSDDLYVSARLTYAGAPR